MICRHADREVIDHDSLLYAATGLLRHAYDRLAHIKLRGSVPVIDPSEWLASSRKWSDAGKSWVYRYAFFLIPYEERLRKFESIVARDRLHHQPKGEPPVHRIAVRRGAIFQDTYEREGAQEVVGERDHIYHFCISLDFSF